MAWVFYNPNPRFRQTNDCVIRAISKLEDRGWVDIFMDLSVLCVQSFQMPDTDTLWGEYLWNKGYRQTILPPSRHYTLKNFCSDNQHGKFLVKTTGHVVAVIDGDYYDAFDSGEELPIYYWSKER